MCVTSSPVSCHSRRPSSTWVRMRSSCKARLGVRLIAKAASKGCIVFLASKERQRGEAQSRALTHSRMDMNAARFEGRIALVTGGNSGIGLAVARALADEGARVVIAGRNAQTVASAAARIGKAALGVAADAGRLDGIDRIVAATRDFGGGRLDVIFANAGVAAFGPLASTTEQQFDELIGVNVKGVYFTVQKALA